MKVLITGGAGFLGQRLARQLLARGELRGGDGSLRAIEQLVLVDVVPAHDFGDPRARAVSGDIADGALMPAVEALIAGHDLPAAAFGNSRTVNLPGVSVSVGEMVAARISFAPDPAVERIVQSWPAAWDASRALALGLRGDNDIETIIRAYVEEELR